MSKCHHHLLWISSTTQTLVFLFILFLNFEFSPPLFLHSWITHGADANERYRSFARPAVFSHDRLTFTMANHLNEQKSPMTCKLLVTELERVINEEISQRKKLLKDGVRDVSEYINLPPNRIDQLDEISANYDDKRLCFACKHICFFSCVACECSKSKVSCLRHSHFMCRCATEKRYMMIWSTENEMKDTLNKTKSRLEELEKECSDHTNGSEKIVPQQQKRSLAELAPGVDEDDENHRNFSLDVSASSPMFKVPVTGQRLLQQSVRDNRIIIKDESKIKSLRQRNKNGSKFSQGSAGIMA